MNYTIKAHAKLIKKMYDELAQYLPSETSEVTDLKPFLKQLKVFYQYSVGVHEVAKTEEQ